jgi:hypothetical protein
MREREKDKEIEIQREVMEERVRRVDKSSMGDMRIELGVSSGGNM